MAAWKEDSFRVSRPHGIETKRGWTYNHIGLVQRYKGFQLWWEIIHLNSGHALATVMNGTLGGMQDMAAEIADAGDWSFDGLEGFKNQFPDAAVRVNEIVVKHRPELRRMATNIAPDPVKARAIAMLREDEMVSKPGEG